MSATVWLLLLVPFVLALVVQRRLRSVFRRYDGMANRARLTGAQVARSLLDAGGLSRVRLERTPGELTDHYDGQAGALRLSEPVADERSVAAEGIAAHEVSHAYQDAEGSRAYRARKAIGERLARVAPWSTFFLIAGFWFGIPIFVVLSLVFVGGLVVFAAATLPVELGASRRALTLLRRAGLADDTEVREVRQVLNAAALTYVVGLLNQLGFFLALLFVAEAARRAMA